MKINKIAILILCILVYLLGFFTAALLFAGNHDNKGLDELFQDGTLQKLQSENSMSGSINIVAVTRDGQGAINKGEVEIKPGKGRVLINANPFVEPDTQYSFEIARGIAEKFTQKSLADWDVIYTVADTKAALVGGPSAGAAFTLATIAAVEGMEMRGDASITGTIEKNGKIGQIGGVVEKMLVFGDNGGKLFLVPKGQSIVTYYTEVPETYKQGYVIIQRIKIVPKTVDLAKVAEEQFGMEMKEVDNIKEAYELMLEK